MQIKKKDYSVLVRNFNFGVEDSIVSTVGLLSGIAIAGVDNSGIVLTGFVLIFVEGFSMAIGSLLSERYVQEYQEKSQASFKMPFTGAIIMFFSYILAGLIPLFPYFLLPAKKAIIFSVAMSLIFLFVLGVINAKMFKVGILREGLFALLLGGAAIIVGIVAGQVASVF